jgi:O-antigen/teichoic acid export membrane protein
MSALYFHGVCSSMILTVKARIIKKLRSTLRTDIGYLFRGGSYLAIGQVIASASGLAITVGLAHALEQAEYGLYSYILSLAGFAAAFTLSGMDTAVAQATARGNNRTLLQGFKLKLLWCIPMALGTLVAGIYYLTQGDTTIGYSLLVVGTLAPFMNASSLYGAYFIGKRLFKKIAHDNVFTNIAIATAILATAYLTHNVVYIVIAYFLSSTLIFLTRTTLLIHSVSANTSDSNDTESLSLGKHLSAMDVFSNVATHLDKIIVFQLLGATSLALYVLALAPIKQLQGIAKLVRTLVLPKFSLRSADELRDTIPHKFKIFFVFSFSITLLYCLIAEFAFEHLFPKYTDAVVYSQALSLSLLFMPFILHTQALTVLGKKHELYVLHLTKPFIKIGLLLFLVPTYGIWGAVGAHILFNVTHYALLTFFFLRMEK